MKHWNKWLKTLHNLTLDRKLRHLQLYIHFNSMKQSTSWCFVQWKCVKVDEVVLLQKGISVDLHQKDLLHVCILSQLTSNWLFWCYFRKVPHNDYIRMMELSYLHCNIILYLSEGTYIKISPSSTTSKCDFERPIRKLLRN